MKVATVHREKERERDRESGASSQKSSSTHTQHHITYTMHTVDNRDVFILPFFDIPLHNRNLYIN